MKNLLLAVTLISLTFLSCSKKDDDTTDITIYEGTWRGSFSGDSSGTWIWDVSAEGIINGTYIGQSTSGTSSGVVTESGKVSQSFSNGYSGTGQINAESGIYKGTWSNNNPNNPKSGTAIGTKD